VLVGRSVRKCASGEVYVVKYKRAEVLKSPGKETCVISGPSEKLDSLLRKVQPADPGARKKF